MPCKEGQQHLSSWKAQRSCRAWGSQACATDWNTPYIPSAQSLVRLGRTLWSSLDRELPSHVTDCWRTVVTVKLPYRVSDDAWKNPGQSKATTLWLVTIQCPDSQWWCLWQVCHPLACLSVEFSVGFPIECPLASTFTACISVWGTSKNLFLTDTNVKSHLSSWRCQGPDKLGVPKPAVLIRIHLVYHLHRAWFAQEGSSSSHLIGDFLAIWMTNFAKQGNCIVTGVPSSVLIVSGGLCDGCVIHWPACHWNYLKVSRSSVLWQRHTLTIHQYGGTSNDLFLTDWLSKLYYIQSSSSHQQIRISVTKHLGGCEPALALANPWLALSDDMSGQVH